MIYFKRNQTSQPSLSDIKKRMLRPSTLGCIVCGILASLLLALVLIFGQVPEAQAAPKHRIKFSTLAPEGSSWMKVMRSLEKELQLIQQENQSLKDRSQREWFIAGAGVLLGGMLLGLIIPKLRWRKKSGW